MTYGAWEVVGQKDQEIRLGKTIGDAFRDLITKRFQENAAKKIERAYDFDPKTAKNIVQRGCVSERSLTKAARVEGWSLWMALGEELFGQPYTAWEEARLTKIIEGAARDLERVRRLRPTTEAVPGRSFARNATDLVEGHQGSEPAAGREGRGRGRPARSRTASAG